MSSSSMRIKASLRRSLPVVLLIGLSVVFLDQLFFAHKTFFMRDFSTLDLPGRLWLADSMLKGVIPFWCSLTQCGVPGAAQPIFGAFYPPNWLFLLPSIEVALRLWLAFHLSVAAFGFYAFARQWRFAVTPALFGAISFAFSMYVVTWMEFAHGFCCMVWGPFGLLFITRIVRASMRQRGGLSLWEVLRKRHLSVVGFALVTALQLLASGEFFYYGFMLNAAYILFLWLAFGNIRGAVKSACLLVAGGLIGIAISMPEMALTLELISYSDRSLNMDSLASMASAHPKVWLTFLLPYLFGRPGYPTAYWAQDIYEFALGGCYVGVIPILCAAFLAALFLRRCFVGAYARLAIFFIAIGLFGIVMASGKFTPVYGFLHSWLPGLTHLRFPTKFLLFTTYSAVALGMIGLQVLLLSGKNRLKSLRKLWLVPAGICLVVCLGCLAVQINGSLPIWLSKPLSPDGFPDILRDFKISAFFCLAAVILFSLRIWTRMPSVWIQGGILAAAFLNLWIVGREVHPAVDPEVHAGVPEQVASHITTGQLYRVGSSYGQIQQYLYGERRVDIIDWARESFGMAFWLRNDISTVATCATSLARYRELYNMLWQPATSQRIADLLCVRYFITGSSFEDILWKGAPRNIQIIERPSALPRAFVVANWKTAGSRSSAMGAILDSSFDPSREAIIETDQYIAAPEFWGQKADTDAVKNFTDRQNELSMDVSTTDRNLLVVEDSWFPGWHALVDGVEQPILRVNYMFRGVFMTPGSHHVKFIYRPTYWIPALISFGVGCLACLGLAIVPVLRLRVSKTRA